MQMVGVRGGGVKGIGIDTGCPVKIAVVHLKLEFHNYHIDFKWFKIKHVPMWDNWNFCKTKSKVWMCSIHDSLELMVTPRYLQWWTRVWSCFSMLMRERM